MVKFGTFFFLEKKTARFGTVVEFSCPTGFLLVGEKTQECRDDGNKKINYIEP